MSRTQKEKLETYPDASLLLMPENPAEESAVTAADGYNLKVSSENRKKEADKPLYLRRV
jgi:hypothetical protein